MALRELACVAGAWKWWAKGRTGVREGDTRGVREKATKLIKINRAPRVFL